MTPEEVLEAAFPWPGKTVGDSNRETAVHHDRWVAAAKPNYLNRMALMEKMERL